MLMITVKLPENQVHLNKRIVYDRNDKGKRVIMISPRNMKFVPPGVSSANKHLSNNDKPNDIEMTGITNNKFQRLKSFRESLNNDLVSDLRTEKKIKKKQMELNRQLSDRFTKLIQSDVQYNMTVDSVLQR